MKILFCLTLGIVCMTSALKEELTDREYYRVKRGVDVSYASLQLVKGANNAADVEKDTLAAGAILCLRIKRGSDRLALVCIKNEDKDKSYTVMHNNAVLLVNMPPDGLGTDTVENPEGALVNGFNIVTGMSEVRVMERLTCEITCS